MNEIWNPEPDDSTPLARALRGRVRELDCLFGLSDLVEKGGGSLDRILEGAADMLPSSLAFPEIACARIRLEERAFISQAFEESEWCLETDILVNGEKAGAIHLFYKEEPPPRDDGTFSAAERRLLTEVAQRLGHIAERLTTQERLRESEAELRARMTHLTRVSTMGEMASSIAHEVNQPLTAIATYAQACKRLLDSGGTDDEEVRSVLGRISDEALRAGNIIHRLRSLVKRRRSDPIRADLISILEEIAPLALGDARLNDVDVTIDVPAELPMVMADGVQIQQVVLNLIRNGIDAMENLPAPDRKLAVRVSQPGPDTVQVSVRDNGVGLPPESESALFEPFFTTKEGGLGMGLSISKSIISAHGGRLWFDPHPQGGTTFSFTLPTASGDCRE